MSASRSIVRSAADEVAAFCERRVLASMRDQMRLECSIRGSSITIDELRAPWNPDLGSEWTRSDIAQLRYAEGGAVWSLYWRDSSDRWHLYEPLSQSPTVARLLLEIDEDPKGFFWG